MPARKTAERFDKAALLEQLKADLKAAIAVMLQAAHSARDAATHEENKPENDKDTRGIEAGYLAGAQAVRAAALQRTLSALADLHPRAFTTGDRVDVTALVDVEDTDTGARQRLFLCPQAAGMKVRVDGKEIQVVTPQSPLGDALMGKKVADLVEVVVGGKTRELEICAVS